MRPLIPTLRENKRYIGFEILSDTNISFNSFESSFQKTLQKFIGNFGRAKAGAFVVKEQYKENKGIIRVNTKYVDHLKAVFTLIKNIDDKSVIVKSVRTSGMINKALR